MSRRAVVFDVVLVVLVLLVAVVVIRYGVGRSGTNYNPSPPSTWPPPPHWTFHGGVEASAASFQQTNNPTRRVGKS